MPDPIYLPGGRDARGTLDAAAPTAGDPVASGAAACVVACPPHPQHGGDRTDPRLRAVAEAVCAEGSDCLRFDYGPWDGGHGERTDALHAVEWAGERYDRVALFGYSFGGSVALSAAANGASVVAVAALAPPAHIGGAEGPSPGAHDGIDAVADLGSLSASLPVGLFYGARDDVADVGPVVDRARERGATVREFAADHFFVGRGREVAAAVTDFLAPALQPDPRR